MINYPFTKGVLPWYRNQLYFLFPMFLFSDRPMRNKAKGPGLNCSVLFLFVCLFPVGSLVSLLVVRLLIGFLQLSVCQQVAVSAFLWFIVS